MNAIDQIDLENENLTINFLVPHSSDMLHDFLATRCGNFWSDETLHVQRENYG